jgi:hypothetical protein
MSILCLGMLLGLPHLEMLVGVIFIGPNTILVVGEKLLLSHRTARWRHRTVRCPCPVRLAIGSDTAGDRCLQAFTPDSSGVTSDSSVASLHQFHQELAIGLHFPGAPDNLVSSTGQSARGNTFLRFLDFA